MLTFRKGGTISRFGLKSVSNATENGIVIPDLKSQIEFYVNYENSFAVFPDESTVAAIQLQNRRVVLQKNLSNSSAFHRVCEHKNFIFTVILNRQANALLVGDRFGRVAQYDLRRGRSMFKTVKDYGDLEIGLVSSGACFNHLAVLGGDNYRIRIIDVRNRRIIGAPIVTAIKYICSLKFGVIDDLRVVLCVTGIYPDYSDSKSDLFDLTKLFGSLKAFTPLLSGHQANEDAEGYSDF